MLGWLSRRNLKDVLAGLLFIAIALILGWQASLLPFGTAMRMDAGYFPLVLSSLLGLLGVANLIKGLVQENDGTAIGFKLVALAPIVVGTMFFALTVRGLGLGPTTFVTAFVSAFASRYFRPLVALGLAGLLSVFCVVVFVYGLGVPLPVFGPWLGN